jgi:hypothetical protein
MSDYSEMRDGEVMALRAELAKANVQLADLRHLLKVHGAQPLRDGLTSLSEIQNRILEALASHLTREERQTVEQAFTLLHGHLERIERVLRAQDCACGDLALGEQSLEETLAEARAARERAAQVERDYLEATDKPRGKVISLGARLKHPRMYEQTNGQPLHPTTAECFAGGADLPPDGPEAA